MIATENQLSLWRTLREAEPRVFLRISVSISLASLLVGLALLGGGVAGVWFGSAVRPSTAASALLLAACCIWVVGLWRIWGAIRSVRPIVHSAVATVVIALLVIAGLIACDEYVHRGEAELMTGWFFSGFALIMFTWISAIHRLNRRFPVLDRDNQVRVHCPNCSYSLIGLTELRCPECGTTFTIDELIRAQRYAGAGQPARRLIDDSDRVRELQDEPEPVVN